MNDEIVVDVKLLSNSTTWVRVGNILSVVPQENQMQMVTPKYDIIDQFESNFQNLIQKSMLTEQGVREWQKIIEEIKAGDSLPQWSFSDFPKYVERQSLPSAQLQFNERVLDEPPVATQSNQELIMMRYCYFSKTRKAVRQHNLLRAI